MSNIKNSVVVHAAIPTGKIDPNVHFKYTEHEIDIDNVPLHGGVLLKTIALSSDPYMRYRMRDPSISMFCPPLNIGDTCVCVAASFNLSHSQSPISVDNSGVAIVLRSNDSNLQPGDYVWGYIGMNLCRNSPYIIF